jgi:glycine hydroxymethyltransferase
MAQHVIVGSGAIGTAVANLLVDAGHTVRIVTRRGSGPDREGVERVAADATDAERLTALTRGAVALYNCANPPYDKWLTDWPPLASSLLTAAERTGAGLVTMGNLYGYGPVDGPMTEETPLAATGPRVGCATGCGPTCSPRQDAGRARVTEARASDFYGPGPVGTSHLGQYFMPRLLAGKRPLVMQADLDAPHSFTYVPDVARTLVTLAGDDRAWGRAWHVPTAPAVSLREIATRMAVDRRCAGPGRRGAAAPAGARPRPRRAVRPRAGRGALPVHSGRSCSTREAAQETFGLAPTPLADGLAAHVHWWRAPPEDGEWRCERLNGGMPWRGGVRRCRPTSPTSSSSVTSAASAVGRPDPAALTFYASLDQMRSVDPLVADRVVAELVDQRANIKLIASENYASLAVQQAMGNLLTDKYAEGSAGHRFYAGCDNVDAIESHGAELAKALFGAEHAYLQPHSGIDANLVAFIAILATRVEDRFLERLDVKNVSALSDEQFAALRTELHDQRLLGMDYYSGGHLTHGYRFNISSRLFDARGYTVDRETGLLDLDALRTQLHEVRPLILLAGYSAYTRKIDFARMRELADEVGATFMVDMAHFAGLVAGKVFTGAYDPVPHAHVVTSTTHKTLRGPRGGIVLSSAEYADAVDKGCPAVLGGPLPHVMASKAVALKEASQPSFREYAARIVDNAAALADGLQRRGARVATGGTDNHIVLADVSASFGLTGRQAESGAARGGHDAEPQLAAVRRERPLVHQRPAAGHSGADHARAWGWTRSTRSPPSPSTCSARPRRSASTASRQGEVRDRGQGRAGGPRAGRALCDKFPVYPEIDLSIVEPAAP